ncbi:hypothetical protein CBL_02614 [Carabus blaptoides fortunei]
MNSGCSLQRCPLLGNARSLLAQEQGFIFVAYLYLSEADSANGITLIRWSDKSQVIVATNQHDQNIRLTKGQCKRWSRKNKSSVQVDQPILINLYNQGMDYFEDAFLKDNKPNGELVTGVNKGTNMVQYRQIHTTLLRGLWKSNIQSLRNLKGPSLGPWARQWYMADGREEGKQEGTQRNMKSVNRSEVKEDQVSVQNNGAKIKVETRVYLTPSWQATKF